MAAVGSPGTELYLPGRLQRSSRCCSGSVEKQQAWILQLCLLLLLQSTVLPLPWHEGHGNPPVKHFLMFYSAGAQALLEGGLWHCGSQRFLQQLLQGAVQGG